MDHLDHISWFLNNYLPTPNPFFFSVFCKAGTETLKIAFLSCQLTPAKGSIRRKLESRRRSNICNVDKSRSCWNMKDATDKFIKHKTWFFNNIKQNFGISDIIDQEKRERK